MNIELSLLPSQQTLPEPLAPLGLQLGFEAIVLFAEPSCFLLCAGAGLLDKL